MFSPSNSFECRWQASGQLLAVYLLAQLFAWGALLFLDVPLWASLTGVMLCTGHAVWALPRNILLNHPLAFRGLRRDADGWQLWNADRGWQSVQLSPDSLALPLIVVLRFRLPGQRRVRTLCVPHDAQSAEVHRRLRLRLKFSRRRWAAPE